MPDIPITTIEEIDTTLDPVTEDHGLEMLGNIREQPVELRRFSRAIFKIGGLLKSLGETLADKESAFSKNSAFNKEYGNQAGTVSEGNYSAYDGLIDGGSLLGKTELYNTHKYYDVSGDWYTPYASTLTWGGGVTATSDLKAVTWKNTSDKVESLLEKVVESFDSKSVYGGYDHDFGVTVLDYKTLILDVKDGSVNSQAFLDLNTVRSDVTYKVINRDGMSFYVSFVDNTTIHISASGSSEVLMGVALIK